ncbi:MAG TPA: CHAD domain-containing protein [Thermomicrobiales bacterium]|nr:CHAD domain-containing protein [Sphingomicrobium sp.]HEX5991461.1 CHAD domain-containing protein [Thermomicrobiales bacterium]
MSRAWPVHDVDPDASVIDNARRVLAVRVAEFYSFEPIVPYPELSAALHDLRISAKRLRYTLELFRPQFGKAGERQIERVKAIQEELGTLHDHDVRIDLIGDELSQLMVEQSRMTQSEIADASSEELAAIATAALRAPPDDPRRGLIALLGREHTGRRAAYTRFRELWDMYARDGMRRDLVALSVTPLPKQLENSDADSLI